MHYNSVLAYLNCICRYGYVSPDDVPVLLHKHIGQGEIVDHLWRYPLVLKSQADVNKVDISSTNHLYLVLCGAI
jgi:hypothetical protein